MNPDIHRRLLKPVGQRWTGSLETDGTTTTHNQSEITQSRTRHQPPPERRRRQCTASPMKYSWEKSSEPESNEASRSN